MDARAANGAKSAGLRAAAVASDSERFEFAGEELKRLGVDGEAHAESAARLALALGAVTDNKIEWGAIDAITDMAALAAA
jgi:hypothetical protein